VHVDGELHALLADELREQLHVGVRPLLGRSLAGPAEVMAGWGRRRREVSRLRHGYWGGGAEAAGGGGYQVVALSGAGHEETAGADLSSGGAPGDGWERHLAAVLVGALCQEGLGLAGLELGVRGDERQGGELRWLLAVFRLVSGDDEHIVRELDRGRLQVGLEVEGRVVAARSPADVGERADGHALVDGAFQCVAAQEARELWRGEE